MEKVFTSLSITVAWALVAACSGSRTTDKLTVDSTAEGAALIAKSDCISCHKDHDRLVGPAYADIAKKYSEVDIDKLAGKVITGGAGSFGDIPMLPHPALSIEDAREIVKYILTVK